MTLGFKGNVWRWEKDQKNNGRRCDDCNDKMDKGSEVSM